jgi:hypothetical protein
MIGNKNNYAVDAQLIKVLTRYLKGQSHKIFCFCFFSWISFPPSPRVSHIKFFQRDIRKSRCTTGNTSGKIAAGINYTCNKLPQVSTTPASVVDTGGKFASGVNDTEGKFAAVSTTPMAICHQ